MRGRYPIGHAGTARERRAVTCVRPALGLSTISAFSRLCIPVSIVEAPNLLWFILSFVRGSVRCIAKRESKDQYSYFHKRKGRYCRFNKARVLRRTTTHQRRREKCAVRVCALETVTHHEHTAGDRVRVVAYYIAALLSDVTFVFDVALAALPDPSSFFDMLRLLLERATRVTFYWVTVFSVSSFPRHLQASPLEVNWNNRHNSKTTWNSTSVVHLRPPTMFLLLSF